MRLGLLRLRWTTVPLMRMMLLMPLLILRDPLLHLGGTRLKLAQSFPEIVQIALVLDLLAFCQFQRFEQLVHVLHDFLQRLDDAVNIFHGLSDGGSWPARFRWRRRCWGALRTVFAWTGISLFALNSGLLHPFRLIRRCFRWSGGRDVRLSLGRDVRCCKWRLDVGFRRRFYFFSFSRGLLFAFGRVRS